MKTLNLQTVRFFIWAGLLVCVSFFIQSPSFAQDTSKKFEQCKDMNWVPLGFRNQGECVSILATGGMIWHLADDFLLFPNQANPNPDSDGNANVWWFQHNAGGLNRDPANFTLLHNFTIVDANREDWNVVVADPPVGLTPLVGLIKSIETMIVHPDFNQLVVTGWRSPVAGTVNIRGGFTHVGGGGNGVRWYVDHYDGLYVSTLANGVLVDDGNAEFGLDLMVDVEVGDFLYFSVDPNPANAQGPGVPGDSDFDSTLMSLTISGPVPSIQN